MNHFLIGLTSVATSSIVPYDDVIVVINNGRLNMLGFPIVTVNYGILIVVFHVMPASVLQ